MLYFHQLFMAKYDPNTWFNPRYAINLLWSLRKRFGEQILTDNNFQKEREAWAVAASLLGIKKLTGQDWWLQIPEAEIPDIEAMTLVPYETEDMNYLHHRLIEVMEITTYTNDTIVNEILRKLKNKCYQKETCLLVHMRRNAHIQDMRSLSAELKEKIHGVADIWLLGSEALGTNDFILFSLSPDVQVIRFNIDGELPNTPPVHTLIVGRGKGTGHEEFKAEMPVFNPHHKPIKEKQK